jgi:hypothetical protein
VNGLDVAAVRRQGRARRDGTTAAHHPQLTAHWVGGKRARIDLASQSRAARLNPP